MFYLSNYFKTLWYGRSVGMFYGALTLLVLTFAANIFTFKEKYIDRNKNPYFNALFTAGAKPSMIMAKLKEIPGVENVVLSENLTASTGIRSLLDRSSANIAKDLLAANYVNLKVELSPHIEKRSQDLIMEYLRRMLGKTKVTMTNIINQTGEAKVRDPLKSFVIDYGHYMILIFLSIVWVFATWVIGQKMQNRSYLINMYQRRSLVAFKIFTSGQVFWLLLSLGVCFYLGGNLGVLTVAGSILTITGLSLLSIRKNEFIKA